MIKNPEISNLTLSRNQTGFVLLAFLLVLIVGSSYAFLSVLNRTQVRGTIETTQILNDAKQALISFSATFPDRQARGPGYLPCPDSNNDGSAEGVCALADATNQTIGWLPFETLELQDLRDHSGARLWYAVSENHRSFLNFVVLNSETEGDLTVDAYTNIVAVIIAPGRILADQSRFAPDNAATEIQQYLEGDNRVFTNNFVTTLGGTTIDGDEYDADGSLIFNDQLIFITQRELMESVEKRVLGEIKQVFSKYQRDSGHYPWLAPFTNSADDTFNASMVDCTRDADSTNAFRAQDNLYSGHIPLCYADDTVINPWFPKWFISNGWHHLAYIAYAEEAIPGGSEACVGDVCLQIYDSPANNKIRALAVLAGHDLTTTRPSDNLSDYFEGHNTTPLDHIFQHANTSLGFNDKIKIISIAP